MVYGYVRVSTRKQDVDSQRLAIHDFALANGIIVEKFIAVEASSRVDQKRRRIDELIALVSQGDTIIVSELSRIGRSTGEVIDTIRELVQRGVSFVAIKQGFRTGNKLDMNTKVTLTMLSLFAEVERDLISERTIQGLAAKKAQGIKLGKPKGTVQKSKLDDKRDTIITALQHGVSKSAIARLCGCSRGTILSYINKKGLIFSKPFVHTAKET